MHWIGQRLLPLFASWCKKLVCTMTTRHCCWIFVPGRLFLEGERTSVSAHRAIFSHCLQYGNHRTGGAIDMPTQSATKHPLNYGIGNESCELNHLIQTSVAVNAILISTWKVSFDLATERTFGCIWHHLVSTCSTSFILQLPRNETSLAVRLTIWLWQGCLLLRRAVLFVFWASKEHQDITERDRRQKIPPNQNVLCDVTQDGRCILLRVAVIAN